MCISNRFRITNANQILSFFNNQSYILNRLIDLVSLIHSGSGYPNPPKYKPHNGEDNSGLDETKAPLLVFAGHPLTPYAYLNPTASLQKRRPYSLHPPLISALISGREKTQRPG